MVNFLIVLSCALFLILCISVYFNIKHAILIIDFTENIENSLDVMDQKYVSISEILEKPVFFDSMEVRQVMKDISDARDSLLFVANSVAKIEDESGDE
jgi:hypothetical protein